MHIMKKENLTCKVRLKKYRSYRGTEGKIEPNIIKRNFTATKPAQNELQILPNSTCLGVRSTYHQS